MDARSEIRMLSAHDLAEILGSRALAYRLFNAKGFPTVRLGKRVLVREDSLDNWLLEHEGEQVWLHTPGG